MKEIYILWTLFIITEILYSRTKANPFATIIAKDYLFLFLNILIIVFNWDQFYDWGFQDLTYFSLLAVIIVRYVFTTYNQQ